MPLMHGKPELYISTKYRPFSTLFHQSELFTVSRWNSFDLKLKSLVKPAAWAWTPYGQWGVKGTLKRCYPLCLTHMHQDERNDSPEAAISFC